MVILASVRIVAYMQQKNRKVYFMIGKQIQKRRKELKMSVDMLARRIGKDRSTVYRYEKGNIESIPLDMLLPIAEALETTPQYLLATENNELRINLDENRSSTLSLSTSNEWLTDRAERWFDATGGYEFNEKEVRLFFEIAKYFMKIQNAEDYEENMSFLFLLFKQLNK